MGVRKVDITELPKEKLEELQPLLKAQPVYVAIGKSVYELYPTPATKLLEVLADIVSIITNLQEKKKALAETLELSDEEKRQFMRVTITDILSDKETVEKLKGILKKVLDGVDENDFDNITTGQLIELVNKVVEVNINTLPPSVRNRLMATADQIGLATEANQGNQ